MNKIITIVNNIIASIHDNKLWGVRFNFDGGQTSIKPQLVLDIDYEIGSDYFELEDKIVFSICPANLIFNGVSTFDMNLSSGDEEMNHYKADCLYIARVDIDCIDNERYFIKIMFCDDVGFIEFYADDMSLVINENNTYKVDGNCSIPISLRNEIKNIGEK